MANSATGDRLGRRVGHLRRSSQEVLSRLGRLEARGDRRSRPRGDRPDRMWRRGELTSTVALPAGCSKVTAPAPKPVHLSRPGAVLRGPAKRYGGHELRLVEIVAHVRPAETASSFAYLARRGVSTTDTLHESCRDSSSRVGGSHRNRQTVVLSMSYHLRPSPYARPRARRTAAGAPGASSQRGRARSQRGPDAQRRAARSCYEWFLYVVQRIEQSGLQAECEGAGGHPRAADAEAPPYRRFARPPAAGAAGRRRNRLAHRRTGSDPCFYSAGEFRGPSSFLRNRGRRVTDRGRACRWWGSLHSLVDSHERFAHGTGLTVPLLSDPAREVARETASSGGGFIHVPSSSLIGARTVRLSQCRTLRPFATQDVGDLRLSQLSA